MLAVSFPFHLGAVANPIRRALHADAALLGLLHLRIAPQVAAVRLGDEVGPPVVGRDGLTCTNSRLLSGVMANQSSLTCMAASS